MNSLGVLGRGFFGGNRIYQSKNIGEDWCKVGPKTSSKWGEITPINGIVDG